MLLRLPMAHMTPPQYSAVCCTIFRSQCLALLCNRVGVVSFRWQPPRSLLVDWTIVPSSRLVLRSSIGVEASCCVVLVPRPVPASSYCLAPGSSLSRFIGISSCPLAVHGHLCLVLGVGSTPCLVFISAFIQLLPRSFSASKCSYCRLVIRTH